MKRCKPCVECDGDLGCIAGARVDKPTDNGDAGGGTDRCGGGAVVLQIQVIWKGDERRVRACGSLCSV